MIEYICSPGVSLTSLACMVGALPTGTGRDGEMKASFGAAGVWAMTGVVSKGSSDASLNRICEYPVSLIRSKNRAKALRHKSGIFSGKLIYRLRWISIHGGIVCPLTLNSTAGVNVQFAWTTAFFRILDPTPGETDLKQTRASTRKDCAIRPSNRTEPIKLS